jgi:DNA-binding NtrC family response regulator
MLEMMGWRVCLAATIKAGLEAASDHAPGSKDPLDLIILDMHLPIDEENIEIKDDGGVRFLKGYKLAPCPIVVFTAYPTFANCVAAIQAGAAAYIPKMRIGSEGGPEDLRETCERLLREREEEMKEVPPTRKWLEKNARELMQEFGSQWVAFADAKKVPNEAREGNFELDGVVLLAGGSYDDVRAKVIASPAILLAQPAILKVRGMRAGSQ